MKLKTQNDHLLHLHRYNAPFIIPSIDTYQKASSCTSFRFLSVVPSAIIVKMVVFLASSALFCLSRETDISNIFVSKCS